MVSSSLRVSDSYNHPKGVAEAHWSNHVNGAGQWNTYDIRCQGSVITLSVNGTKSSEFDQCHNLKGYLGLEAEGSRIEFRNLRIRNLR